MYVSHPVRRLREAPAEGETVTLKVTATDGDAADLAARLAEVGTVEERLRFGAVRVTVDQTDVGAVCALSGVESVETAATVGVTGDAGEDVEPE